MTIPKDRQLRGFFKRIPEPIRNCGDKGASQTSLYSRPSRTIRALNETFRICILQELCKTPDTGKLPKKGVFHGNAFDENQPSTNERYLQQIVSQILGNRKLLGSSKGLKESF